MNTTFRNKHFITTNDWTKQELDTVFEVAFDLKRRFAVGEPHRYLPDKTLFMIFFEQSTRTRNSMEAGFFVNVATVATRDNYQEIPQIMDLCEELGVNWLMVYNFVPTGRGRGFADRDLTPQEQEALLKLLWQRQRNGSNVSILSTAWRSADIKAAWRLVVSSLIGIPFGLVFLKNAPEGIVKAVLGLCLSPLGFTTSSSRACRRCTMNDGPSFLAGLRGCWEARTTPTARRSSSTAHCEIGRRKVSVRHSRVTSCPPPR